MRAITAWGPSLRGLRQVAASRAPGLSAEDYIRLSMLSPAAYIVEGYSNYMPPNYADVLDDDEIDALVAFVLTLEEDD